MSAFQYEGEDIWIQDTVLTIIGRVKMTLCMVKIANVY